jgi:hypothetical protein
MSIFAIITEALRIGRAHRSLWLFGFLVGFGAGGGGGGSSGFLGAEQANPPVPRPAAASDPGAVALVLLVVLSVAVTFVILKFLGAGALIEGVRRVRRNGSMTMREGFREGWAHWGVLLRIALLYLAANFASVAALALACYAVGFAFGEPALFVAGALAVVVGVPWLVTLYMWQAFAERIAVFENRRALDAIRKARLFLHGRLQLGLRLLVAGFLGVLFVGLVAALAVVPLVLAAQAWGFPAVAIAMVTLPPVAFIAVAFVGIVTSSVWTIGYLTETQR